MVLQENSAKCYLTQVFGGQNDKSATFQHPQRQHLIERRREYVLVGLKGSIPAANALNKVLPLRALIAGNKFEPRNLSYLSIISTTLNFILISNIAVSTNDFTGV